MADKDLKGQFSKLRTGDKVAFEEIYTHLKQPVFTVCWRIVGSREAAEDLTHDVFVKLYVSPPDPSVKNERAWIFRMARNLAIDALRKRQHTDGELVMDDKYYPFKTVDVRLDVESAINMLPYIDREVLSLRLNGGLSFKEVGAIMGLSLPATYRRYRKAIKFLRETLNGGTS